jgi:hypothetical protein
MSNSPTRKTNRDAIPPVDLDRSKRLVRPRKGREHVSLRTLREGMGKTQSEVARAMGTDQGEVSRIERRGDVQVSTLRRYAEAVGARLELTFVFDKTASRALIEEPDPEAKPVR